MVVLMNGGISSSNQNTTTANNNTTNNNNNNNVNHYRYGSHTSPPPSRAGMHPIGTIGTVVHHNTSTPSGANLTMNSTCKQPLIDLSRTSSVPPVLNTSRKSGVGVMNSTTANGLATTPGGGPVVVIPPMGSSNQPKGLDSMGLDSVDLVIESYGIHEMLASLALMCVLSLLMAFLALFFLQRTGPVLSLPEDKINESSQSGHGSGKGERTTTVTRTRIIDNTREYIRVFQISVSLSTLTISLNLCCLFVCCIQFLSAIKLLKTPQGKRRTDQFLKKTSHIRVMAIGAFLISIPIFFTGVILFTFINFDEVPALATSVVIGIGIVFCGVASVQNVYLWQCEKTKASQELSESRISQLRESGLLAPIELSTLV